MLCVCCVFMCVCVSIWYVPAYVCVHVYICASVHVCICGGGMVCRYVRVVCVCVYVRYGVMYMCVVWVCISPLPSCPPLG